MGDWRSREKYLAQSKGESIAATAPSVREQNTILPHPVYRPSPHSPQAWNELPTANV